MKRYVLVGSGIAALAAAESIRACDARARITVVSREAHPFYSRPGLAYFLTGELPEARLSIRSRAELQELRIERVQGVAVRIDVAERQLSLEDGRVLPYDRLLLAPGAESLQPTFEGAALEGVLRLDGLDDARLMRSATRRARHVVVIGGGITALEIVEAFVAGGARVHYLMRSDRYWPRLLDSREARMVESRLEQAGVQLHHHAEIARAFGRRGRIEAVETRTGERIACDVLAAAIGVRPRTALAEASGLRVGRGIVVDELLRTSATDVFAAGDAVEVHESGGGAPQLDTLWSVAAAQGRAAGRTMAGSPTPLERTPALNVTRLAGITTTIIGSVEGGGEDEDLVTITRGQSERWHALDDGWALRADHGHDRVRLVLGTDRLAGAVIMGDQALSGPVLRLIRDGIDTTPLRAALREHPEALEPLVLEFERSAEATHAHAG